MVRGGGGFQQATTDELQIREWWLRWPRCNIGLRCVTFTVFDVDSYKPGGVPELDELVRLNGKIPPTPTLRTGSGGYQFFFHPLTFPLRFKPLKNCDLRNAGGYVLAPPSTTLKSYVWLRPPTTPLAVMPAWLQPFCRAHDEPPLPEPSGGDRGSQVPSERRLARAMAYLEKADPAIQGNRGSDHTFLVVQHVAVGFALSHDEALLALQAWNARCDPPWSRRELEHKIRQALSGRGRKVRPGQHL